MLQPTIFLFLWPYIELVYCVKLGIIIIIYKYILYSIPQVLIMYNLNTHL